MTQYDPHSWTSHLFDIRGSLVREILGRVALCAGWSLIFVVIHEFELFPSSLIEIPETAHSLVGAAVGLLLVFRTNSSYDRFWEGRKLWGGIVNETRNLVRQASVLCRSNVTLIQQITDWTMAFPYACMHHLRGQKSIGPIANRLPPHEAEQILSRQHVPLAVAQKLTSLIQQARSEGLIGEYQQMQMDQNVQLLIDYIGACERIHSTPMPYSYAVHLRRALILYCFTLPFALVGRFGWGTIPATLMMAYVLFGIEEIGVEIEDPFGTDENDLPLETICSKIQAGLEGAIAPDSRAALPTP